MDKYLIQDKNQDQNQDQEQNQNKNQNQDQQDKLFYDPSLGLNIKYVDKFFSEKDTKIIFKILEKRLVYNSVEDSMVKIAGRYIAIPRSQVAYGEPNTAYQFAGNLVQARNWQEDGPVEKLLRVIVTKIEKLTGIRYNFVLINRYKDGAQYIGYHKDDERDLVPNPTIAGVSFGCVRTMSFQQIDPPNQEIEVNLGNGSLILIQHPTNQKWKHSIPKASHALTPRISLTFRQMLI